MGVAVNVSGTVTSGEEGLLVKETLKAAATVMVWLDMAFTPLASVAVTVTVNGPEVA